MNNAAADRQIWAKKICQSIALLTCELISFRKSSYISEKKSVATVLSEKARKVYKLSFEEYGLCQGSKAKNGQSS